MRIAKVVMNGLAVGFHGDSPLQVKGALFARPKEMRVDHYEVVAVQQVNAVGGQGSPNIRKASAGSMSLADAPTVTIDVDLLTVRRDEGKTNVSPGDATVTGAVQQSTTAEAMTASRSSSPAVYPSITDIHTDMVNLAPVAALLEHCDVGGSRQL
jgi:hypothetical protein